MTFAGQVDIGALVADIANREKPGRTEADVQSGLKVLLLAAPLELDEDELDVLLEAQAGKGRRIDVEVGATVIEVKKDLRVGNVRPEAVAQLAGYVAQREATVAHRYTGVLTDGAEWRLYHLEAGELVEVSVLTLDPASPDVDGLVLWLEGVLATTSRVRPTPREIERRLGARSSGHALGRAGPGRALRPASPRPHREAQAGAVGPVAHPPLSERPSRTPTSCSSTTPCWSCRPSASPTP